MEEKLRGHRNPIQILGDKAGFGVYEPQTGYIILKRDVELSPDWTVDLAVAHDSEPICGKGFYSIPCIMTTYIAQDPQTPLKVEKGLEFTNRELESEGKRPLTTPDFFGAFAYVHDNYYGIPVNHLYGVRDDGKFGVIEYYYVTKLKQLTENYPRLESITKETISEIANLFGKEFPSENYPPGLSLDEFLIKRANERRSL